MPGGGDGSRVGKGRWGVVELLFIDGGVWILAMVLPWWCCQEKPSKGVVVVVVRRQERELWTTTRVPKNNIGPGRRLDRRKTQENDKEDRERERAKDKRGGDEGKGVQQGRRRDEDVFTVSCRVVSYRVAQKEVEGSRRGGEKEARSKVQGAKGPERWRGARTRTEKE